MPATTRAEIKPELLRWARETSGLSPEDAAHKLQIKVDRLRRWEAGRLHPTIPQLRKAAAVYKRPLAAFFLSEPPPPATPLHDFRRLPEGGGERTMSPALLLAMRRARRSRGVAVELARTSGRAVEPFPVQAQLADDPDRLAARLRSFLGITLDEQSSWTSLYRPLNAWITALETKDLLVFQTSHVALDEMRGFSLSERAFPVIVLNSKDSPRARVFTLMHELVHVALNDGGVCDPLKTRRVARSHEDRVEVFCNRVAGALLVPAEALTAIPIVGAAARPRVWEDSELRQLAQAFGVSEEVILRRLLIVQRTTEEFYQAKRREYLAAYAGKRKADAAKPIKIPPSRIVVRNNGRLYTQLVLDALDNDRITFADVADYLSTNLKHLDAITALVHDSHRAEALV
jgi:Zn-dependent peptidase ImmA (M78 family)/transcriptional regulator with XRE-family HTH domain